MKLQKKNIRQSFAMTRG